MSPSTSRHFSKKPDPEDVRLEVWNLKGMRMSVGVFPADGIPELHGKPDPSRSYLYISRDRLPAGADLYIMFSAVNPGDVAILNRADGQALLRLPAGAWTRVWIHGYNDVMQTPCSYEILPEDLP